MKNLFADTIEAHAYVKESIAPVPRTDWKPLGKTPAEIRAFRGAQLLDKKKPGWEGLIELRALDISRGDMCILGQVYGGYTDGLRYLEMSFMSEVPATNYGFVAGTGATYYALDEAWSQEIIRRRGRV